MGFVLGVRQIRGEMDIAPSRKLPVLMQNASPVDLEYLARNGAFLERLAGIETPRTLASTESAPISAVALLGTLEILVPMAGLIEPDAEIERLEKRRRRAQSEQSKLEVKLANAEFVRNAPAEIIAKDRVRLAELTVELSQLDAQLKRVAALRSS
jgi:valyl-tRNA synthetase